MSQFPVQTVSRQLEQRTLQGQCSYTQGVVRTEQQDRPSTATTHAVASVRAFCRNCSCVSSTEYIFDSICGCQGSKPNCKGSKWIRLFVFRAIRQQRVLCRPQPFRSTVVDFIVVHAIVIIICVGGRVWWKAKQKKQKNNLKSRSTSYQQAPRRHQLIQG